MYSKKLQYSSIFKIVIILSLITLSFYLITYHFRKSLLFQILFYLSTLLIYLFTNREKLLTSLSFYRFMVILILAFEILFLPFIVFSLSKDDFSISVNSIQHIKSYYHTNWERIVRSTLLLPNIFAFMDLLLYRLSIVDIIIATKGNSLAKGVYLVLISGIEVMERLRIYFKYHPLNRETSIKNFYHYIAVPLALFFGIMRKFEYKINTLYEREQLIGEKNE